MDNLAVSLPFNEMLMFYNVENLFVADEKPLRRHLPSASGLRNWNDWRYNNKLYKIASVFQLIKNEKGILPMLIGLSEVQGRQPVKALSELEPLCGQYDVVHFESMDERGVDVALLFDKSKLQLLSSEPISFIFEIDDKDPENYDTTRDILYCRFRYETEIINIFVLHLPSKREKDINKPKRDYIMKEIRERAQSVIKNNGETVILMGDFNENPDDENLKKLLYDEENNKILQNPFIELYSNKSYSTFHFNDGLLFDQIILSGNLMEQGALLEFAGAEVFRPEQISNWDKRFAGRPFRTYAGTRYLGGYSDHFPVLAKFKINNKNQ